MASVVTCPEGQNRPSRWIASVSAGHVAPLPTASMSTHSLWARRAATPEYPGLWAPQARPPAHSASPHRPHSPPEFPRPNRKNHLADCQLNHPVEQSGISESMLCYWPINHFFSKILDNVLLWWHPALDDLLWMRLSSRRGRFRAGCFHSENLKNYQHKNPYINLLLRVVLREWPPWNRVDQLTEALLVVVVFSSELFKNKYLVNLTNP